MVMSDKTITLPRVSYDDMLHTARRIQLERDKLRAEINEVWANVAQERNDLRAENERLRADLGIYGDHLSSCLLRQQPRVEVVGRSRCNCGYFEAVGKGLVDAELTGTNCGYV